MAIIISVLQPNIIIKCYYRIYDTWQDAVLLNRDKHHGIVNTGDISDTFTSACVGLHREADTIYIWLVCQHSVHIAIYGGIHFNYHAAKYRNRQDSKTRLDYHKQVWVYDRQKILFEIKYFNKIQI